MLVLTRKVGEAIVVPKVGLLLTVVEVHGDKVRLGLVAMFDPRTEMGRALAAVLLQQLAGEHPAAGLGDVQALGPDSGPQFAQGTLQPGHDIRPVDHRPDARGLD